MMKRTKLLVSIVILIVLVGIIVYATTITRVYDYAVTVPFSMLKTGEQLNTPSNVVKWYQPFSSNDSLKSSYIKTGGEIKLDDESIQILKPGALGVTIKASKGDVSKDFLFVVSEDSAQVGSSRVYLLYESTLFGHLIDKGDLKKKARESLENLKVYMEDTKQFYGIQIEQTTVTDTAFLFMSETVPKAEKREATKKIYEKLIAYANEMGAGYTGTRIFYSTPYGTDKVMLFASIGVNKWIETPANHPIENKRMPFGKNLLVALYHGPYGEVSKAYTALENYKADHQLTSMAIPYQQFISEGFDFADDQIVQMKVYYPIF